MAAHLRCSAQYPTLHALLQAASGHEGDQVVTLYGPVNNSGSQVCKFLVHAVTGDGRHPQRRNGMYGCCRSHLAH